jgi:hypothetical protein
VPNEVLDRVVIHTAEPPRIDRAFALLELAFHHDLLLFFGILVEYQIWKRKTPETVKLVIVPITSPLITESQIIVSTAKWRESQAPK